MDNIIHIVLAGLCLIFIIFGAIFINFDKVGFPAFYFSLFGLLFIIALINLSAGLWRNYHENSNLENIEDYEENQNFNNFHVPFTSSVPPFTD